MSVLRAMVRASYRRPNGLGTLCTPAHPLALALALALALGAGDAAAQVDPSADYQALRTEHFRVTYQPALEAAAYHAAARAEAVHAHLSATLVAPPSGMIDIVLADDVDYTNGMAGPLPSNRIWIYATPPVDELSLASTNDWIDLVVTHELTHIFHLDVHGKLGDAFRTLFGRVPFTWPVFPALGTPLWSIEGLAVQVESALTDGGRIHGSWHETVVRTATLAGQPDPIDRVSGSTPIWPGNERVYIYGSLFLDWVARTHGDSLPGAFVREVADSWLPPGLFFNGIPRDAAGATFTQLYDQWQTQLQSRYASLADSLRTIGLTAFVSLTDAGYGARHPRIAHDGRIAYAASDGRTVAQTRIIDATGTQLRATRRNTSASLAWTPDGQIITSQLEWDGRYRFRSDLYRIDREGREHRLTDGERLRDPDVAPDARHIVAIKSDGGITSVALLGFDGERITTRRTIARGGLTLHWALPRFSPDGTRIAVARSNPDGYQVVLMDLDGNVVREVDAGVGLDMGATFSPDGRWLVFSSDRSGIANLYAADLHDSAAPLRQVTNVLGAAYDPDVAPDGSVLAFAAYQADGFHIARMPFEPATWRVAPPPTPIVRPRDLDARAVAPTSGRAIVSDDAAPAAGSIYDAGRTPADTTVHATGTYRPWSTLRPYYWLPLAFTIEDVGTFLGASSLGRDVTGRHAWSAQFAVAPDNGRTFGDVRYTWAGWRNPTVTVGLARDYDDIGFVRLADTTQIRPVIEREDVVSARLGVLRPRVRTTLSATFGGELVRRSRNIENGGGARLVDRTDDLVGIVASAGINTTRAQALSISREDGISLSVGARQRWDRGNDEFDGGYRELTTANALFQSLDLPGFARHVLALRASGLYRDGIGATPSSIGGASGLQIEAPVEVDIGPGSLLLPVRGFPRGVRAGTRAWTATAEYRFPLALVGRGIRILPLFLDRLSGAVFADAGDAWCESELADRYRACSSASPRDPLVSAGAELNLDLGFFGYGSLRTRIGAAFPIQGPDDGVAFYLRLGTGF